MTILVVGDANADLSAALERFPREGDDSLVVGLEWGSGGSAANGAVGLALIEQACSSAIPLSLDLCLPLLRAWRDELLDLLPRLEILFANELELAALFPGLARDAALAQAVAGDVGLAALKLGPHGCLVVGRALWHAAPAFSVAAVDTNGCGDAFVAGFLYAHPRGEPP